MSDRIVLERIAVFAHHGALPEEARTGQRFYLSLDCAVDLAEAGRSDDLAASVSYVDLAALAVRIATGRRFTLIEALAHAIATELLAAFPRLSAATVRIDKPGAPLPVILDGVAVIVTRHRDG